MADRLKTLQRIARVQGEMVKLAEWRMADAERRIASLRADRATLADYAAGGGGLGVPLAKAALRSMLAIDRQATEVERRRALEAARLETLRRKDRAVARMTEEAGREARRTAEAAVLAEVMEAFLARPIEPPS